MPRLIVASRSCGTFMTSCEEGTASACGRLAAVRGV
jgi:hypothetical protein